MNAFVMPNCPPPLGTLTTGLQIIVRTFTQSGAYMPSPGLMACVVECIGGGGAGGGASIGGQTGFWSSAGGGGGSGGYSRKSLTAAMVAGGVQVTVGAGAVSPGGGAQPYGGDTSFGALCVAKGGQTGMGNAIAAGAYGIGGFGAPVGIGDVAFPGNSGQTGAYIGYPVAQANALTGGVGGAGLGGANDITIANWETVANGANGADGTGAGGQGGIANQPLSASQGAGGGNGGSGLCVVTEYCWNGGTPPGGGMAPVPAPWPGPCTGAW